MAVVPFVPTHTVPPAGARAWDTPDGTGAPAARLDPGLDVQVVDRKDDWARIVCSNGWQAWVDGRQLLDWVATPEPPRPRQDSRCAG